MSDLTDEELKEWESCGRTGGQVERMIVEIRRRRAAETASKERVREVVRATFELLQLGLTKYQTDVISQRVAEQLTAPVRLSDEDRNAIAYLAGWCNAELSEVTVERDKFERGVAALDRMLGAAR